MKSILSLVISLVVLFILPFQVFALAPPTQISPTNGATVTSPKLEWQTSSGPLYSTTPYKVQLADNPDFTSPKTPYYTSNTYYSPTTLSNTTWYWKVNVRDSDGNWSGWSNVWNFTLISSAPTPTETPMSTPPTTSTPTPFSTSQPNSSFIISNTPSQIYSDQSFSVSVNLSSPNNPNTKFYLKGAFKKAGGSNYFGLTEVSGDWVTNGSSYSDQFPVTTDSSGSWPGNLEVKPDSEDKGFTGTGDYIFKVGKYNASDASPSVSWSNEVTINIIYTGNSDADNSSTNKSSQTNSQVTPTSVKTKPITSISKTSSKSKYSDTSMYQSATVAGTATSTASATTEAKLEIKNQKQISPIIWIGLIFIFAGAGTLGYIYLKSNAKIRFPFGR